MGKLKAKTVKSSLKADEEVDVGAGSTELEADVADKNEEYR